MTVQICDERAEAQKLDRHYACSSITPLGTLNFLAASSRRQDKGPGAPRRLDNTLLTG